MKRTVGRKHHPYAMLAIFTLAGASMINIVNRAKRFIKDKGREMTGLIKKATEK
ncbi:MAG: hypothetical protein IJY69_00270 [Clostridia bacterium]|nr:hypothetical protein [Clostridia bacterium]